LPAPPSEPPFSQVFSQSSYSILPTSLTNFTFINQSLLSLGTSCGFLYGRRVITRLLHLHLHFQGTPWCTFTSCTQPEDCKKCNPSSWHLAASRSNSIPQPSAPYRNKKTFPSFHVVVCKHLYYFLVAASNHAVVAEFQLHSFSGTRQAQDSSFHRLLPPTP